MKKVNLLLIILFILTKSFSQTSVPPSAGDGTEGNPYQIATLDNLYWLSQTSSEWGKYFIQTADIDASSTTSWDGGLGFLPIGFYPTAFTGHYNGQGYSIDNLFINRNSDSGIGLFGYLSNAVIENLTVTNVSITTTGHQAGALAGNCTGSEIYNSYSSGNISGDISSSSSIGGLAGYVFESSVISNSYSSCNVTGNTNIGGLVGYIDFGCNINNCYGTGEVTGTYDVGGLCGRGTNTVYIYKCFSTGSVSGEQRVGGFIGNNDLAVFISVSYSMGNVTRTTGTATDIGGFCGDNSNNAIFHCYSLGSVFYEGDVDPTDKGFVGSGSAGGYDTNNFFDSELSNQDSDASGSATPKTTAEMTSACTFLDAGWDFVDENENGTQDYWVINSNDNNAYPTLQWQGYLNDFGFSVPVVTTENVSNITGSSGTGNGTITDLGVCSSFQHGVCWNTTGNPTTSDSHTTEGIPAGTGTFTSNITGLSECQTYYVRSYITNNTGTSYGDEASFTTTDETNPVITSNHGNQSIDAYENCEALLPDYSDYVSATDNCDTELEISQNPIAGSIISGTINTVTLTVTDDSGNSDAVSFNVEVVDNTGPNITSTHNNQYIDADEECMTVVPDYMGDVTAVDNCDTDLDISQTPPPGTVISGTENLVTLTVRDDNQNETEIQFNIEVVDNLNPIIYTNHPNQSINANENCQAVLPDYSANLVAGDNCTDELNISQTPIAGTIISGNINQVTLTVTDDAGNESEVSFNVEVVDNTYPIITSNHPNQFIDADENCQTILPDYTETIEATDNCTEAINISQTPEAGTIITGNTNEITLTVSDDAGNKSYAYFNVSVVDNTAPEASYNDQSIDADENCQAVLPDYTGYLNVSDNCDSDLSILQMPVPGTIISGITNPVTFTVKDDNGNQTEFNINVEVIDNTAPELIGVNDAVRYADNTHTYTVFGSEFDLLWTNDNCGTESILNDYNNAETLAEAVLPEGITPIIWTVADVAGNETTCDFSVLVNAFAGVKTLQQNGISIYPNPTSGFLNFTIENNDVQKITISDLTGKELITKNVTGQFEPFDISNFNSGVYIVYIEKGNEILTAKIIKE